MSSDKRLYIVLALIAVMIVTLFVYNFEYRKVADVSWEKTYDKESKDPYGTWLFHELLQSTYPEAEWVYGKVGECDTIHHTQRLYVRIAERASLHTESMDSLYQFLDSGHQVLMISDIYDGAIDSLYSHMYYTYHSFQRRYIRFYMNDSLLMSDREYTYVHMDEELDTAKWGYSFPIFQNEYFYDSTYTTDLVEIDSTLQKLAIRIPYGEKGGEAILATAPILYTNISLQQDDMILYLDRLLKEVRAPQVIYWDDRPGVYMPFGNESQSPLKYILSQRGLRAGYFMLTGISFLFILFRSRRRQKIIPIKEKIENSSMEYIDTLSKLYLNEERHEKLVGHLEKIFYHNVEKEYFLSKEHPDFTHVLAKKSRQNEEDIVRLIERFEEAKNAKSISTYQLQKISERIEEILG